MKPIEEHDRGWKGIQKVYEFDNGYGASVIKGPISCGKWELAVLKDNEIFYDNPIVGDVKRYETWEEVEVDLNRIKELDSG